MATQTEAPSTTPSVQVVGNTFVEQYYHILHHNPELVYKFYQDSSVVSRSDRDGAMTSVTTMKGINDKICSLDYTNYKAEIKTADAQESYKDGVIILVTGCLTGKEDNFRRKFSQSFFLAPQDKGYFVLNDVFRYVDESESLETNNMTVDGTDDNQSASLIPDPSRALDPPVLGQENFHEDEIQNVEEEAQNLLETEGQLANENTVEPEPHPSENHLSADTESISSTALEDAPKMSYASIVSSQTKKGSSGTIKVYVPAKVPSKTEKRPISSVAQSPMPEASEPIASSSINSPDSSKAHDEGEGHSIYIRNLPMSATVSQLELEFKKFGPIKQGGVQVRSKELQGFCFGFVEFQDLSSMHNAIQASPVPIGGQEAVVEMKRTTTRVGSARGRFLSGRGGFRSDSFRVRGNFSGVRGYVRNDFGGRGDFSGQGRGPGGRGGEGYHQEGRGRGGRRGVGPSQTIVPA